MVHKKSIHYSPLLFSTVGVGLKVMKKLFPGKTGEMFTEFLEVAFIFLLVAIIPKVIFGDSVGYAFYAGSMVGAYFVLRTKHKKRSDWVSEKEYNRIRL